MYNYFFELLPSKRGTDLDFCEHREKINEAVENINNGLVFKRDRKKIEITSIERNKIKLTLSCKTPLVHSARSLSSLTRYLTTHYTKDFEPYISNKTLFSMNLIAQENAFEDFDISNEEMLKGVIDLLYTYTTSTNKEVKQRDEVIKQIKELVKPYICR